MFFSDGNIFNLIEDGRLEIAGFSESDVRTASIDLRVSSMVSIPDPAHTMVEINSESSFDDIKASFKQINIGDGKFTMKPGDSVIATTNTVSLKSNIIGLLISRNSLIRLCIDISPCMVSPGYSGILPFTIKNNSRFNFSFSAGDKLCQLIVAEVTKVRNMYYSFPDAKYVGSTDPMSRYDLDSK